MGIVGCRGGTKSDDRKPVAAGHEPSFVRSVEFESLACFEAYGFGSGEALENIQTG